MKKRLRQVISLSVAVSGASFALGACSSAEIDPKPPAVVPPPYVQAPHPEGFDLGDARAIFGDRAAPSWKSLEHCEDPVLKLNSLSVSKEEIADGTRELVLRDPVNFHWCFYSTILRLEDELKKDYFLKERQQKILVSYTFLVPVARAYLAEFHDSRYLRWANSHYRKVSEWVFYRKLEPTPQSTSEMVEASNPFGLQRSPLKSQTIIEKYGLLPPGVPTTAPLVFPQTTVPSAQAQEVEANRKTASAPEAAKAPAPELPQQVGVPQAGLVPTEVPTGN